ncbi:alpha-xylosidase [Sodiomyces alkalinus F11]|uniref:Alpha-xylosidase n=1 Tax=Sodiomyces alkalinus (strain CBS 110278 / VKM F-3762 / F11) TaxID=1314773 RepID=A0A3N2Q5C7_SODAK|nr:alpha-xylosidase [Sodiomyces alkalinus F11]ROT41979.1 alpha-xylosidase [Sodiomyces alkalinus F11]
MLEQVDDKLVFRYDAETLWIQPWGANALRIRSTRAREMPDQDWALLTPKFQPHMQAPKIEIDPKSGGAISLGKIKATISQAGKILIHNAKSDLLLEEYTRNRNDVLDSKCSALEVEAREFKPIAHSDAYRLTARFESVDPDEKLFGMGQYQQPFLDLKGHDLELAHRNSQASVPFLLSSLGYGLLWNNPSIGRAFLGRNIMSFEALSAATLDYWVVAGDVPAEIVEAYADATGKVPMMPEFGLGFWQCKLRYQTQEELLGVAREYKRRRLPIDLIVIDFFHWPLQGDWAFDPTFWPDPDAMIAELREAGIELMVSIWPTVDKRCGNYAEMLEKGYLIRTDRGVRTAMDFQGDTVHFDATHPGARDYVWRKAKQNYHDRGIRIFWLDEAEPEYKVYDFDHYRYHAGPNTAVGNLYPRDYARAFSEGMAAAGQENIVNLVRCAWAGSQKYGALVWSGDIASSWPSLRDQVAAGLHMGLSGFPWWTTDIGGFHGGDPSEERFRELFVRWFQWGAFCPVMRLHGDREPKQPRHGTTGGSGCLSGAPNEVWSYGPAVYEICKNYMFLREKMREYSRGLMKEAHEKGTPVMRTLFYEFPEDNECWTIGQQYMFGHKFLVCPVLYEGRRKLKVYFPRLPEGEKWSSLQEGVGKTYDGGRWVEVDAPLEWMPVFVRG